MSRIEQALSRAQSENRAALVAYLCAGDPDPQWTPALVRAAARGGADIVELGVPFSDPTADGIAIQQASARALGKGTTLARVLEMVREIRTDCDVPILLFGYYNPILKYGEERFAQDAADAGADGALVVDLPPEHASVLRGPLVQHGLDYVPLLAPTSDEGRVQQVANVATSFIYFVSLTGVTGAAAPDLRAAAQQAKVLKVQTGHPVAVGFGIKSAQDVASVARDADGAVVGTALIKLLQECEELPVAESKLTALISELAAGTQR